MAFHVLALTRKNTTTERLGAAYGTATQKFIFQWRCPRFCIERNLFYSFSNKNKTKEQSVINTKQQQIGPDTKQKEIVLEQIHQREYYLKKETTLNLADNIHKQHPTLIGDRGWWSLRNVTA
jgi:hypothetical protein